MSEDLKQNLIALLEEQFIRSDDKVVFDYVMQKKSSLRDTTCNAISASASAVVVKGLLIAWLHHQTASSVPLRSIRSLPATVR